MKRAALVCGRGRPRACYLCGCDGEAVVGRVAIIATLLSAIPDCAVFRLREEQLVEFLLPGREEGQFSSLAAIDELDCSDEFRLLNFKQTCEIKEIGWHRPNTGQRLASIPWLGVGTLAPPPHPAV